MKTNLIGFFVSLCIHGSLAWFAYSLAKKPTSKSPVEKPIPLQLSMFKAPQPVTKQVTPVTKPQSKPEPEKIATPTTPIAKPKPIQAEPAKPKPVKTKPQPVVKKLAQQPKAVKPKKTPKKISKKEKKPKPVEKEVTKKQERKPKKVVKEKVRDKALDDMILAYQATQKKQTAPKPTPTPVATTPQARMTQPQHTQVTTKQPVKVKQVATPLIAKKPAIKTPQQNEQAEQRYKARLQRLIAQQKTYPKRAQRRRQEGTVMVSFMLYASGKISQIRIKKSSGSNSLDKAALQTIQRVSGALAFPPEIKRHQWQFSLPLVYRLN